MLKADREAVKLGDTLILTTSLCNMTDKDMNVMVALSEGLHNFASGGGVHHVVPTPGGKGAAAEMGLDLIESGGLRSPTAAFTASTAPYRPAARSCIRPRPR